MERGKLTLIHSNEIFNPTRERSTDFTTLYKPYGLKLTNLAVIRPARCFVFNEGRLNIVRLYSNNALQVITGDPDGITRFQSFQYTPDTTIKLMYTNHNKPSVLLTLRPSYPTLVDPSPA